MVFFYNSLFLQVFLNAYYLFRIKRSKPLPAGLKIALYIVFALEILLYLIGLIFRKGLLFEHYALIQKVNVFWVVSLLYFLVLLCFFDLIFFLNKKWVFHVKLKRSALFCFELVVTVLFFFSITQKLQIAKDNYVSPELKEYAFQFEIPTTDSIASADTFKLLALSDLHLGYIINRPVLKKYVDLINSQHPDLIVINGDLIDYYLQPLIEEGMGEELKRLQARRGVYLVPGNHEYKLDAEENFKWVREEAGISLLRDSVVCIDNKLCLIGWDDRKGNEGRASLQKLTDRSLYKASTILFTHEPQDIKEAFKLGIPLTHAGHTHNGQVFPANLLGLWQENYYGMHEKEGLHAYTTSGIGLSGFPMKIMSDSEIVIFNIEIKSLPLPAQTED